MHDLPGSDHLRFDLFRGDHHPVAASPDNRSFPALPIDQDERALGQTAGPDAHRADVDTLRAQPLQIRPAVGIVADPTDISRAIPQASHRHQGGRRLSAALIGVVDEADLPSRLRVLRDGHEVIGSVGTEANHIPDTIRRQRRWKSDRRHAGIIVGMVGRWNRFAPCHAAHPPRPRSRASPPRGAARRRLEEQRRVGYAVRSSSLAPTRSIGAAARRDSGTSLPREGVAL